MTGLSEDPPETGAAQRLEPAEVRRRAHAGAVLLVARGVGVRVLGFAGNVVLAALLAPADFGEVAIGAAIIVFIGLVSDGGLGAALIRGDHAPTPRVLGQLLALQLLIALVLTAVSVGIAPLFGRTGWVVALMTSTACVTVFGVASTIHLERNLCFDRLATIDVAGSVAYLVTAIPAAALGAGVWALAGGCVVQVLVGTALALTLAPVRVLRPRRGLDSVRPLLAFGARFQAISAMNLLRDQGMNVGVAAVAGVGTLGVWTMAYRFIQVPFLLFESLWRVTFPGMARLIEAGEDPRPAGERMLGISAVITAAIMCPLVGATPALVPLLFDHAWHGIVDILPWACAGLLVGGPISVSVAGLLFAEGDAGTVLRGAVLHTIAALTVGLALYPVLGLTALGLSVFASATVEGIVLGQRAQRRYRIGVVRPLVAPTLVAVPVGAMAWLAAAHIGPLGPATVAGGAIGLLGFAAVLYVVDRVAARSAVATVAMTVRSALAPR